MRRSAPPPALPVYAAGPDTNPPAALVATAGRHSLRSRVLQHTLAKCLRGTTCKLFAGIMFAVLLVMLVRTASISALLPHAPPSPQNLAAINAQQSAPVAGDSLDANHQPLECSRSFVPATVRLQLPHASVPPLLWSYPGSGSTMTRTLLDYASGYYTGSVYADEKLKTVLPGESVCDTQVIAVKLHPNIKPGGGKNSYEDTFGRVLDPPCTGLTQPFDAAIIVVRDPYAALWAEYQRFVSHGDHTGTLTVAKFNFEAFEKRLLFTARQWTEAMQQFSRFEQEHPGRSVTVRFEDLVAKDKRESTLSEMLKFLGVQPETNKLACAFQAINDARIHRHKDHGAANDTEALMTRDMAFSSRRLVCRVWTIVGRLAEPHGYQPHGGFRCDREKGLR